ncbi:hypothetical protein [Tumidithrix helvetica]|uniref:hypothetical protein n=1 Tax=Tumidithrix helvetica TaxID=3457545 RepID=UPI003CC66E2A
MAVKKNVCRGIAFLRQFLNSLVPSIWECYAQCLTTQGQFIGESEEGFAFANGSLCGVLENGDANAKPLHNFSLFPFYFCLGAMLHEFEIPDFFYRIAKDLKTRKKSRGSGAVYFCLGGMPHIWRSLLVALGLLPR